MDSLTKVVVDWDDINSKAHFYHVIFRQMSAPDGQGENLDALNDLLVNGGICESGPPFHLIIKNMDNIHPSIRPFAKDVHNIFTSSVKLHGGELEIV
jgi:RNAse (barnase) inhibitor barstar